jgi:adenosylhomocysteine nucleosidase
VKALICFAVAQEKQYFHVRESVHALVTGMGASAAGCNLARLLEVHHPRLIVAAGFAGGLNPELKLGQMILDDSDLSGHGLNLSGPEALFHGKIHSASKVLVTPLEKASLRRESNADAVDMESAAVRSVAKKRGIPMVALRVITDPYDEALPLDFNQFMNTAGSMRYGRFACHLLRKPITVLRLIQFQKKLNYAAQRLGATLNLLLDTPGEKHNDPTSGSGGPC